MTQPPPPGPDAPRPDLPGPGEPRPVVPEHLGLDGLADHLAGEVDASQHLDRCGGCRARLAELAGTEQLVVTALRSLADPPLPAAVGDRLTDALAAEPAVQPDAAATATAALPSPRDATVVPLTDRRRRRTWVPAAAAGLVLAAGGLIGYAVVAGGQQDEAQTSAASAGADGSTESRAGFPTVASGLDYADTAALTAALPALLDGSADRSGLAAAQPPAAPGPAAAQPPAGPSAVTAPAGDPLARLRDPTALAECLTVVLDPANPDERPLALDYATYRGQPALAVVLPDPDPARLSVFVVGPACSPADDDLLYFTRVPRP